MVVGFQPMIQVNLVEVRGDISSPSSWVSVHRNGTCKPASTAIRDCVMRFGLPPTWRWGDFTWLRAAVITSSRWDIGS